LLLLLIFTLMPSWLIAEPWLSYCYAIAIDYQTAAGFNRLFLHADFLASD